MRALFVRIWVFIAWMVSPSLLCAQPIVFEPIVMPTKSNVSWITDLKQDRFGYIWMAGITGVHRYNGHEWTSYFHKPEAPDDLDNEFETIYPSRDGLIWMGTQGLGLDCLNPETGQIRNYLLENRKTNNRSENFISLLYESRDGMLWIGTYNGLYTRDPQTGHFTHYAYNPHDKHSLSHNQVRSIFEDRSGTIWVGTGEPTETTPNEGGLNKLDRRTGRFTQYRHNPKDTNSLSDNRVRAILEDSRGVFWIGTWGDGLHTMDRRTGKFTRHRYNPSHPEQLSRPYIYRRETNWGISFIKEDLTGTIWIGAYNGGVNRYDPVHRKLTHYDENHGALDNNPWTMYVSRDGVIWIGSTTGLLQKTILPLRSASSKTGINAFHDNTFGHQIAKRPMPPPLTLAKFYIHNRPVSASSNGPFKTPIQQASTIHLNYLQNTFSLDLESLDYRYTDQTQFAFYLQNYEASWRSIGNLRRASYYNVPPGQYQFHMKAGSVETGWTEKAITIIISPPWWQTIWFRLTIVCSLILATVFGVRIYTQTRLRRQRNEMKLVLKTQDSERERIAADLHDDLGGVIATINHQLSQSLQTDSLEELQQKVQQIQRVTSQAGHKVRSIAHNLMPPEFERIGLVGSVQQFVSSLNDARFQFSTFGQPKRLAADIELNAYRILSELVHNVQKHAQAQHVLVQLLFHQNSLSLIVEDDGIGNQAIKNGKEPTGIGLKNISSRVNYLGARWQNDASEQGTTTLIEIPYDSVSDSPSNRRRPSDV